MPEPFTPTTEQAQMAGLFLAEQARAQSFAKFGDTHQAALARVRAFGWAFELAESIARPIVAATPKLGLAIFTPKPPPATPPIEPEAVDPEETAARARAMRDKDDEPGVGTMQPESRAAS